MVFQGRYSPDLMTAWIWCSARKYLQFNRISDRQPEHFDASGTRRDGTEIERSLSHMFLSTRQIPRRGTR